MTNRSALFSSYLWLGTALLAQQTVTIPLPHSRETVTADLYGLGSRAVVLAHGGRFGKESWKPQAEVLASHGFRVAAIQFRGDRLNSDGSTGAFGTDEANAQDVLAAALYLQRSGASTISAIGASLGGDAVGEAAAANPALFHRLLFLGSNGGSHPEKLAGRKLFIVAREDRNDDGFRLPAIWQHYQRTPQPKRLLVLDGSAHAQFLFATDQSTRLLNEIVAFLSAP